MSWEEIIKISKEDFVYIGNHSHSHEYLTKYEFDKFKQDIDKSIEIFEKKLNYNPIFFSYPFGEYSSEFKKIIKDLGFKYAFGQHSGVIDETKDLWELPRFPINEKYGELNRFKTLMKTLPFKYEKIIPEDKYLLKSKNPPNVKIFFKNKINNLEQITCFSNEGNEWRNSILKFENNTLFINFREKFTFRRGRVNCSIKDGDNWRWLGIQMSVDLN